MSASDPAFEQRIRESIRRWGIPTGPGPATTENWRTNILNEVAKAWAERPEYRLGQLLFNALRSVPQDLFYVEDTALLKALWDAYPAKSTEDGGS